MKSAVCAVIHPPKNSWKSQQNCALPASFISALSRETLTLARLSEVLQGRLNRAGSIVLKLWSTQLWRHERCQAL